MGLSLTGSVGQGGKNSATDVAVVQSLLNRKAGAKLTVSGLADQPTVAAIRAFQGKFLPAPDGRVDKGGTTWRKLLEAPAAAGPPPPALPADRRNDLLCKAVDAIPSTSGAGIYLRLPGGAFTQIRGGPRNNWVYISVVPKASAVSPEQQPQSVWDKNKDVILNCGSAAATGVVIYLSGGSMAPIAWGFAANSFALCGVAVSKRFQPDFWDEFKRNGGTSYTAWLGVETAMALADLANGIHGAVTLLSKLDKAGKLGKLQSAILNKKLTRKQLGAVIKDIDPSEGAKLKFDGPGYLSRAKLVEVGKKVIADNRFISLTNQQSQELFEAIGGTLTIAGAGGAMDTLGDWLIETNLVTFTTFD
jgi:hypothetical protein